MSLINIISAVGNNRGIAPLFVRDCCIEIPAKLGLTYNQNLKDSKRMANNAVRERFIDEYGTSAIWMGGPVIFGKLYNKLIDKCGYNAGVNMSLFKERADQGIEYNIKKFKEKAPEAVKDLEKALANKNTYRNLQAGKFAFTTAIPIALMGFILPKLNFKLTESINKKQNKSDCTETKSKNISFKGAASIMANMSNVNKMAVTDGGLTIGRVWTARNRFEQMELGFKNGMMMFLNFVFPIYLAKGLDKLSTKIFKTNVNLDPKLMNNQDFLKAIKENTFNMPQKREDIIDFLDKKPDAMFSKICKNYCGVKYLKNNIRDPREFVDTKKIFELKKEIDKFSKEAVKKGNINKYTTKAIKIKSANIFLNVGISSTLLAVALPELIFLLRKKITGSDAEPGLISIENN